MTDTIAPHLTHAQAEYMALVAPESGDDRATQEDKWEAVAKARKAAWGRINSGREENWLQAGEKSAVVEAIRQGLVSLPTDPLNEDQIRTVERRLFAVESVCPRWLASRILEDLATMLRPDIPADDRYDQARETAAAMLAATEGERA